MLNDKSQPQIVIVFSIRQRGTKLSMDLHINRADLMSQREREYYVTQLRTLTGVGEFKVTSVDMIDRVATPLYGKSFRLAMCGRLIWKFSREWDLIKSAKKIKDAADEYALRGDVENASFPYAHHYILAIKHQELVYSMSFLNQISRHFRYYAHDDLEYLWVLLNTDVLLSLAATYLLPGAWVLDQTPALQWARHLISRIHSDNVSNPFYKPKQRLGMLHMAMLLSLAEFKSHRLSALRELIQQSVTMMGDTFAEATYPQAEKDAEYLASQLSALDSVRQKIRTHAIS